MALVVSRGTQGFDRKVIGASARAADRAMELMRRAASRRLDRLHLALRRVEAANDPATTEWIRETLASVEDKSIWDQVEGQRDLQVILDEYREQLA